MRFLADVEQPPRSRFRGLVIGLLIAIPVVGFFLGQVVPTAIGSILGGAKEFDSRLRATDAYLTTLCTSSMEPGRDDELCGCVLAMEFPSLDCRAVFNEWAIARQQQTCADPNTREGSLSYCTCVDTVADRVQGIQDEAERRREAGSYENCESLPDAVPLPEIDSSEPTGA